MCRWPKGKSYQFPEQFRKKLGVGNVRGTETTMEPPNDASNNNNNQEEEEEWPELVYRGRPETCKSAGGRRVLRGHATEIEPGVYLGNSQAALVAFSELEALGIRGIVNCTPRVPNAHEGKIDYIRIPIYDNEGSEILPYLEGAAAFVAKYRAVLVHCERGISRSATVLMAYYVRRGSTIDDAYVLLKSKRPGVDPNTGFWRQLRAFANDTVRTGDSYLASFARFHTTGAVVVEGDLTVAGALDYALGRGADAPALTWLRAVCEKLGPYATREVVFLVSEDDDFRSAWEGDVTPSIVHNVVTAVTPVMRGATYDTM